MNWLLRFLYSKLLVSDQQIDLRLHDKSWRTIPVVRLDGMDGHRILWMQLVYLHTTDGVGVLLRGNIRALRQSIQVSLSKIVQTALNRTQSILQERYPSQAALGAAWENCLVEFPDSIEVLRSDIAFDLLGTNPAMVEVLRLWTMLEGDADARAVYVREHIQSELVTFREFFDRIEKVPLTDEQRLACVVCDDRQLLVAAAGSGKSSTLVAKIGYLLEKGWAKPAELLALAFNKAAAQELTERCRRQLAQYPDHEQIQVQTFHGFGYDLIGKSRGKKPRLSSAASDERMRLRLIRSLVQDAISSGDPVMEASYRILQTRIVGYEAAVTEVVEGSPRDPMTTLRGEKVKSREELKIANFLFTLCIPYEYERPYEHDVADPTHGQYLPDFYFPTIQTYHEHFAIDSRGQAPADFEGYLEKSEWRRQVHAKFGTKFFETRSADFEDRSIYDKILVFLKENGYDFQSMSVPGPALGESEIQDEVAQALDGFTANRKLTGISSEAMRKKVGEDRRWLLDVLPLAESVADRYEEFLREGNQIDFMDMILDAVASYNQSPKDLGIRYLLVDEFQDLSRARANLLQALLRHNPGCKLFGVGDDWQSINGFSGSEVGIMTGFHGIFGEGTTQNLTQTFRSNQGIASVSSEFVMKNPAQLKKSIKASDRNSQGVVEIHLVENSSELEEVLVLATHCVDSQVAAGKELKVFALSRYKAFLFPGKQNPFERAHLQAIEGARSSPSRTQWASSTLHGSKGLEADVVVLLGLVDAKVNPRSFPARVPEDDLVCLPLSAQEDFPDAEERRLMYVALTRARHKVVIPVPVRGISEFVWELLQHSTQVVAYQRGDRVNLCPICARGFFVRRSSRGFECSNGDCLMGLGDHGPSCPKCNSGVLHLKTSQSGFFVGCNRYPECSYIDKELSRKVAGLRPPVVPHHERVVRRSGPLFAGGELEGIQGTATK